MLRCGIGFFLGSIARRVFAGFDIFHAMWRPFDSLARSASTCAVGDWVLARPHPPGGCSVH